MARLPTAFFGNNPGDDAALLRERPQHRLQVREGRLDLDDQKNSLPRMPREDVDRSAIAVEVEGELRDHIPVQLAQHTDDMVDDRRVGTVHKPIRFASAPRRAHPEANVEHLGDTPGGGQANVLQPAVLEIRHDTLAHPGTLRNVSLSQVHPDPHRSKHAPDLAVIHRRIMSAAAHPPINRQLSGGGHHAAVGFLSAAAARALDLAFPARCPGCGAEGPPICGACLPALDARLELPAGIPIGLPSDVPAPLLQLEWCSPFTGVVRRALHELKYSGEQRLAVPLGEAVARRWARAAAGGDVLVPVPVHAERARRRGYDQAELIARAAARELGMPCAPILERARATIAQFDLDRAERATNVAGAFALKPDPHGPVGARPLEGRWIVLVDDVVTTGATLAACADALLEAGAMAVSAIAVARER